MPSVSSACLTHHSPFQHNTRCSSCTTENTKHELTLAGHCTAAALAIGPRTEPLSLNQRLHVRPPGIRPDSFSFPATRISSGFCPADNHLCHHLSLLQDMDAVRPHRPTLCSASLVDHLHHCLCRRHLRPIAPSRSRPQCHFSSSKRHFRRR